ncbi:hypothetical protein HHK36_023583 [Tetracentron sinense]|uniref:Helicase C-terminal domain-containing protein n=1 Tax=Tetracentron sinense TaxID=13715 RepID=A0A834YTG1_TETSI|nr:hypothetical protein HHK36_023583 [Tetracentron sinense]
MDLTAFELVWLRTVMLEMGFKVHGPMKLYRTIKKHLTLQTTGYLTRGLYILKCTVVLFETRIYSKLGIDVIMLQFLGSVNNSALVLYLLVMYVSVKGWLVVLPLYSGLSRADQDIVFSPTPRGKRKVIISTNIAETSLTLEGIVYVVDSGFSKQRFYNPISDIENLVVAPISKASARQRAGRAGRVRPGKCFRLEKLQRDFLCSGKEDRRNYHLVDWKLKALGIDNILGFDWPASPAPEAMVRALEILYSLGILDDDAKLTSPTGFQVAEIPLDPMNSKMILSANLLGCSEEIITIAATLSIQSIWIYVRGAQKELDEAKLRFAAAEGDHVTYLNVYKGFLQSGKSSQWCHKNFVNYHAMKKVIEIREQLRRIAQRLGVVLKSCERDMQVLRKAITAGFFANACRLEAFSQGGMYKTIRSSQEVYIHPSSVLFRVNPKWVIFHSLVSTDKHYMRNVISIDPSWLIEAAPHFYQHQGPNPVAY